MLFRSVFESYVPEGIEAIITPISVKFEVSYSGTSKKLIRSNISLSNKVLEIEKRKDTSDDDCTYYIKGPGTEKEVYLCIEQIEKTSPTE